MKTNPFYIVVAACFLLPSIIGAQSININFDFDPSGNPIAAPDTFLSTSPLTELYAPDGVHFSGPTNNAGGAILNDSSGYGFNALSGSNFLAFNLLHGYPYGPETISFDAPMSSVSIFAASTSVPSTFTLSAYGAGGSFLGSDSVAAQDWSQISVTSQSGIDKVVLSESGGLYYAYDNFSAIPVPEPATIGLLGIGGAVLAMVCRFRWWKKAVQIN